MAYTDQYTLANDATFQGRVMIAMVIAATQVASTKVDPSSEKADRMGNLATRVLTDPDTYVKPFSFACCTNAVITAQSLDSDIQFQINSVFPDIAGVRVIQ